MALYSIIALAIIGFILSLYIVIVEQKLKANPTYKPICNLSDRISCTKPLQSSFARPLGISNGLLGLLFYALIIIFALSGALLLVYYAAIAACLVSLILACILYFNIKIFCLVCSALYVINALLLLASYYSL